MNTQFMSSGGQSQQRRTPHLVTDSGHDSSIAEPQQHDNRYAELTYGVPYNATADNMNQTWYAHDQSGYTGDLISFETNPDDSDDFTFDNRLSTEGAYRQSDHQQGYQPAQLEGNVHRGGKNQYLGIHMPSGHRVNDEVVIRATANMVICNNRFEPPGRGNQVIGLAVDRGGNPVAFSGQYRGNVNEGPGHQMIACYSPPTTVRYLTIWYLESGSGHFERMAEVFGTFVAGAQVVDYTFQICEAINSITQAAGNKKRYQKTGQQLKEIIEQIRKSPHLRTPIILDCTDHLISTINDTHQELCRPRRNQLIASMSFAMKQKKYDSIFSDFERQKTTLALYISQLNNDRLGEITPTVNKIWTKLQCIPEAQVPDEELHPKDQKEQDTVLSIQECYRTAARPSVARPTQTPIYRQVRNNHEKSSRISGRNTLHQIRASPYSTSSEGDAKQDSAVCLTDDNSTRGKTHPEGSTKLPPPSIQGPSADAPAQETNVSHALKPSPVTEFKANVHRGGGTQTIGVRLGPNASMTDADMLKATSNFLAHSNVFTGSGTQVIGQLIQSGATPRQFSGRYYNNHYEGSGNQVIGISFE
ncbi:hypothetical protein FHL15_003418 [Xylaria flabelliformis]|uniref:Uncharacterized protein n=1 Tax=Xylaria flabelliformis TaxID=2512241 RepID=A0A553I6S0_9PEZI|nr:hypothetical protein FHL15_003418 [Xylaria flabelliformis]